jgi:hypothetical protein
MCWPSTKPPFPASGNAADVPHFQRHHLECSDLAHRKLTAAAEKKAHGTTTPIEKQTFFKVGDHVQISTEHLPKGTFANKCPLAFLDRSKMSGSRPPQSMKLTLATSTPESTSASMSISCAPTSNPHQLRTCTPRKAILQLAIPMRPLKPYLTDAVLEAAQSTRVDLIHSTWFDSQASLTAVGKP